MDNVKVQYNGKCAFAVSLGKFDVGSGKTKLVRNNKAYFFSNPIAKVLFTLLPNRLEKANDQWSINKNKS